MTRRSCLFVAAAAIALAVPSPHVIAQTPSSWLQWGGPTRNFMSEAKGFASTWPASGPKRLWSRALGEGHSSIVAENGRLYTMYRQITRQPQARHDEIVASLDAAARRCGSSNTRPRSMASNSIRALDRTARR
jgi:hypothetical protein